MNENNNNVDETNVGEGIAEAGSSQGPASTSRSGKSSKGNKKFKNGRKSDNRSSSRKDIDNKTPGGNDFEKWYNSQRTQEFGSLPYGYIAGAPDTQLTDRKAYVPVRVPLLCVLPVIPTLGNVKSFTDPLNIVGWKLWTQVTAKKSYLPDKFDMPDLMCYHIAVGSLFAAAAHVDRCFKIANTYSPVNMAVPFVQLRASGCDVESWIGTYQTGDVRGRWNMIKQRIVNWPTSGLLSYYEQCYQMFSSIYTEGMSARDQQYMIVPKGFYVWNEGDPSASDWHNSSNCQIIDFQQGTLSGYTPEEMISFVEEWLLRPIEQSFSCQQIRTWLIANYGQFTLNSLVPTVQGETIAPVYNAEMLYMIKNAVCVNTTSVISGNELRQDDTKGFLICSPTVSLQSGTIPNKAAMDYYTADLIIETDNDQPQVSDTVENTRLKVWYSDLNEEGWTYKINGFLWIPLPFQIWGYDESDGLITPSYTQYSYCNTVNGMLELSLLSNFKYHPCVMRLQTSGSEIVAYARFWDIDNYGFIKPLQLARLNYACMMKIMGAPDIGDNIAVPNKNYSDLPLNGSVEKK